MKRDGIMQELNTDFDAHVFSRAIFDTFFPEYKTSSVYNWIDFIESKNIGLVCVTTNLYDPFWTYKIIDEKKWNYARIKYEF